MTKQVVTRIAPSPTGDPHVGTAYIALFNWMFARKHGGRFIVRIEDTDRARYDPDSERMILEALSWLDLDWDEGPDKGGPNGPYRQSERTEHYQKAATQLLENGSAYRCFCAAERLEAVRAQRAKEKLFGGYDRACRGLSAEEVEKNLADGKSFTVRLKVPVDGEVVFSDLIRGQIRWSNRETDDQILLKSDGFPTYHLANVVDDHLMEITHVIRAEEWIASTSKHILLYQAFGWKPPEFAHMPLLRNADKSKISKRKNPCSLLFYQDIGVLPGAMLNFLALQGWSFPKDDAGNEKEIFSKEEMLEVFDLGRVKKSGPVFDLVKLRRAVSGHYIRALGPAEYDKKLREYIGRWIPRMTPFLQTRMDTFGDWLQYADFIFKSELGYDASALVSGDVSAKALAADLDSLADELMNARPWTKERISEVIYSAAEKSAISRKKFFTAVRYAVTGTDKSPPLDESMACVERFVVTSRLRDASKQIAGFDLSGDAKKALDDNVKAKAEELLAGIENDLTTKNLADEKTLSKQKKMREDLLRKLTAFLTGELKAYFHEPDRNNRQKSDCQNSE
ncbi:MAG: glutamate--tRNA ligase [Planctomycetes bacterium]|nr:glutamate--tRNA ligase [Planctomycetota bacterium]